MAEATPRKRTKKTAAQRAVNAGETTVALSTGDLRILPLSRDAEHYAVGFLSDLMADAVAAGKASQDVLAIRIASMVLKSRKRREELLALTAAGAQAEDAAAFVRDGLQRFTNEDYAKLCGVLIHLAGAQVANFLRSVGVVA